MNFQTIRRLACVLLWLVALVSHADKVDDFVRSQMERQHIPGLALAVATNGLLLKTQAYGLANVELSVPARTDTVFQIQSVTKTFTATAIMMLVEERKVNLDDTLTKHFDGLPETWADITIRHLLTHTSGIKDFINEPTVDLRKDILPEDVIDSLRRRPLNFTPGEKYAYSNTGYHLLGMVIRKVAGKNWDEFLRERVFQPLGMNDTRVISWSEVITNRASGYGWDDGELRNGSHIAPTILGYAGGGLRSTVLDLAKWDAALYTERLVKRSTLDQMWTPAKLNNGKDSSYGLGWAMETYHGHRLISHNGAHGTGFKSTLARFVDDRLTVIVLINQRSADPMPLAKRVAAFYIPGLSPDAD